MSVWEGGREGREGRRERRREGGEEGRGEGGRGGERRGGEGGEGRGGEGRGGMTVIHVRSTVSGKHTRVVDGHGSDRLSQHDENTKSKRRQR